MTGDRVYRINQGSIHESFLNRRTKFQMFGGGFANGKTAGSIMLKVLPIARDYPKANILIARSTYPKLNDTIRKEFIDWCPRHWIKSFPMSNNGSNTCTLINGTTINFRYIQQQGKTIGGGETTSNLLSANYDLIVVDQMEDPEIVKKDFDDLNGRLRGNSIYIGDDPTMPKTGPRWFIMTVNPTRNWVYKYIVRPVHVYQQSLISNYQNNTQIVISPDLICKRNPDTGEAELDAEGKTELLISIDEGSTYENKDNLGADFIQALESTYRGQMRDRFLLGQWASYEGLVYPSYDAIIHKVPQEWIIKHLHKLRTDGYEIQWVAGYDYGLAAPSCYLLAFTDNYGNVMVIDGFYKAEYKISEQTEFMLNSCKQFKIGSNIIPLADPAIFRRGPGGANIVGRSVADIFYDQGNGINMRRGNNNITNGIQKVSDYLYVRPMHINPFAGTYGAPYLYFADHLEFIDDEMTSYMWNRNTKTGALEDKPRDGNDHAMDTLKYLLSRRPDVSKLTTAHSPKVPAYMQWQESDEAA